MDHIFSHTNARDIIWNPLTNHQKRNVYEVI
jgi:hypothetical protein